MSIPRLRNYQGPAVLSYGFRPFFLLGSAYAGAMIMIWLPVYEGHLALTTALSPRDWHVHEMLFGYVSAVIGGFLLTAVPNWTGRLPLQGNPLAMLVSTWIAGRVAILLSASIGWAPAAVIDVAFLTLLAMAAAREIIAGRKWSNIPVVAIVSLLSLANVAFHIEAHVNGLADYAARFAIALVIMLVTLIGGRIVPSFTRNWLARQPAGQMPSPFGRFDGITVVTGGVALLAWVALPQGLFTAVLLLAAGALHLIRLGRWAGYRTLPDRLVLILHLAYAFIPLGFILNGLAAIDLVAIGAGIHAWAGGAIGAMTLAVMTRATLGHTGRALQASRGTQVIYAAIVIAALARICASLEPAHMMTLLAVAGTAWVIAFVGFVVLYGPALCSPRRV